MLCVPAVRALVAHWAVRTLPLPARATAEQPLTELAPSWKFTVPVGAVALTVAVNVTLVPAVDGVSDVARLVVLVALLTTWDSTLLVEPLFAASPLYTA